MQLDVFNIISGVVTIISFIFSVILFIQDKALRRSLEAGLTGLIGTLDTLAYAAKAEDAANGKESAEVVRGNVLAYAVASRNHAIALLKSFSNKEERFRTYDFGIDGETPQERIGRRRDAYVCVVEGQRVQLADNACLVEELAGGESILSYNLQTGECALDEVSRVREAQSDRYIRINEALAVTESHELWCMERGWTPANRIGAGDELLRFDRGTEVVSSIELVTEPVKVFAVSVKTHGCFFAGGYLIHNK